MNNFKIGDRVKVVRKVEEEEGWENSWVEDMDSWVGLEGDIKSIDVTTGIQVYNEALDDSWWFPLSSLERIEFF